MVQVHAEMMLGGVLFFTRVDIGDECEVTQTTSYWGGKVKMCPPPHPLPCLCSNVSL